MENISHSSENHSQEIPCSCGKVDLCVSNKPNSKTVCPCGTLHTVLKAVLLPSDEVAFIQIKE